MEKEETFELMPHKAFLEMRRDVDLVKRNPFGPRTEEILSKIDDLTKSLNLMVDAFKEANAHTQNQEVQDFSGMLNPVNLKIDAIIDQNKKIAQGILAVADIAKDALAKTSELEMKLGSISKPEQREDFMNSSRPLNIPMPPPTASAFLNNPNPQSYSQMNSQGNQGIQGGMPGGMPAGMNMSNTNPMNNSNPNIPPPFPNQMSQKNMPMQSGFANNQSDNKKLFKFYP